MRYQQMNDNYFWLMPQHRAAIIGWHRQGASFEDIHSITGESILKIEEIIQNHLSEKSRYEFLNPQT